MNHYQFASNWPRLCSGAFLVRGSWGGALLQGLAKALGFLAGYIFISLSAYHRCKGAIRMVYLGPPFQIFC